jgi:hypothetical protein
MTCTEYAVLKEILYDDHRKRKIEVVARIYFVTFLCARHMNAFTTYYATLNNILFKKKNILGTNASLSHIMVEENCKNIENDTKVKKGAVLAQNSIHTAIIYRPIFVSISEIRIS